MGYFELYKNIWKITTCLTQMKYQHQIKIKLKIY